MSTRDPHWIKDHFDLDGELSAADDAGEDGASLIAQERRRQIDQEGWTAEHDRTERDGRLALAAVCYALPDGLRQQFTGVPLLWPWAARWWKPCPDDRVRELVKAGALIAAEIDRLRAAALLAEQPGGGR